MTLQKYNNRMQDKDANWDEEACVKVNFYMTDRAEAASAAKIIDRNAVSPVGVWNSFSTSASENEHGMDSTELLRVMEGALGSHKGGMLGAAEGASRPLMPPTNTLTTTGTGHVNTLSDILENLGIPGVNSGGETLWERNRMVGNLEGTTSGGGRRLTLADLQGAIAGLATTTPLLGGFAPSSPPLPELTSADVVDKSGILNDPFCVVQLIALLPEGQRSEVALRENVRSPQVAQCLLRLTSALTYDGGGFNSITANFQLNPDDGADAMAAGNPVGAFLNCLLRDIERNEGVKENVKEDKYDHGSDEEEDNNNDDGGRGEPKGGDPCQDKDVNINEI